MCFPQKIVGQLLALLCLATPVVCLGEIYRWENSQAVALPGGDLQYAPEPFTFATGSTVRYIDFEGGSDSASGESHGAAWKHHPWDPDAQGNAATYGGGPTTYVFKQGVTYRGRLEIGNDQGTADEPIRLTRDPTWGSGEARIYGSEQLSGWTQGAHDDMPTPGNVWYTDLDFAPRCVWLVADDGTITRLKLARTPNWEETDPYDVTSEWWTWDQPAWWINGQRGHTVSVDGRTYHLGIDEDKQDYLEDSVGGYAWTEWGIVMGSPYATRITYYGPGNEDSSTSSFHTKRYEGVNIGGPWNPGISEALIRNCRYYLEDLPWMLDEPGEFWFDKSGGGGRLYVWLPDNMDPNAAIIEAGRHKKLIKGPQMTHLDISGLTFRFTNVGWDLSIPGWSLENVGAAILLQDLHPLHAYSHDAGGSGENIVVRNNLFEHVNAGVLLRAGESKSIESLSIHDNTIRFTDHEGIVVTGEEYGAGGPRGIVEYAEILRNHLTHIGWRNRRGSHGHAMSCAAVESVVAGNFLERTAGWGIAIWGGKRSGETGIKPLSRQLVFQNRVQDPLLKSNDWGGIETWQGGPFYVFNNVSINPGGFKNWKHQQGNGSSRFGFAYYLDGAFKNYLFNNVAIGRNNDEMSKYANTSAFQGIIGFQNEFFNNTAHKFLRGSRQQAPDTGRYKYLGNVFSDISVRLFRHTDINGDQNPNDDHYDQGSHFGYEHMAYANNVVANLTGSAGGFEEDGTDYPDTPGYQAALDALNTLAHDEAFRSAATPFANADGDDFTPSLDAGMIGGSVQVFVPWALAATVAEWPFHQNHNDPNVIIDEHWYMLDYYRNRSNYKDTPRYPLQGSGLDATDYVAGTLEDWTRSALQFSDGKYASLPHSSLTGSFSVGGSDWPGSARRTVDMQENSFLIEAVVRRDDDADGVLVRKMDGTAGYALEVVSGALQVTLKTSGGTLQVPGPELPQGQFHHVLVEVDRGAINQVTLYLNGEPAATEGPVPGGSLSNSADFLVAGGRDQEPLECTFDFLRIARSTLAESRTTIDELVAWQFEGPFLRDFTGASRHFASTAAGAIGSPGDTDSDHLDDLWELDQTGDLSPTTTGDTAQRGTSNLLRFALDIDPKSGVQLSTEPLHIDTERVPGEKWLVLRYRKSTAADHLQISVWRCDSLTAAPEDWVEVVPDGSQIHQSVAHPNPDGDGSAILMEMRCRLAPSQGQGFYRVKVAPQ